MYKVALVALLCAAAQALKIGTLDCCPESFIYDEDTLRCVCPPNAPYVAGNGLCISCNAPSKWDEKTGTCQKCRADQSEDASGNCVCPKAIPYNNGTACTPCPDDLPIWNGKKCVACPAITHYDYDSKTCTVCPEGMVYVAASRKCEVQQ
jgi:hypothetical protein